MNYRETPRTALVFTGSIADINDFEAEIRLFLTNNMLNKNALLLYINSSGGINEHVFGLCGLLRRVKAEGHPLYVHVLGQLCHFTYLVGAMADWLIMEPSASLVFGQPTFKASGSLRAMRNEILRREDEFADLVNAIVKRSNGKLTEETVRGWRAKHITAQDAYDMGLCDQVLTMPLRNTKPERKEFVIQILGSFNNDKAMFDHMITLNTWLENTDNIGAPIRVIVTSHGGKVSNALSLYGLLLEAQRRGHHVTVLVLGQVYSCALWFATVCLNTGTVEVDPLAKFMFHEPWVDNLEGPLDEARALLSIEEGIYAQTRKLLQQAPGFTDKLVAEWESGPDHYFGAAMAEKLGIGTQV